MIVKEKLNKVIIITYYKHLFAGDKRNENYHNGFNDHHAESYLK